MKWPPLLDLHTMYQAGGPVGAPVSERRLGRGDLVDSAAAPAAAEAAEAATDDAAANTGRVAKYLARYQEVQAKRAAMQVPPAAFPSLVHAYVRSCHCLSCPGVRDQRLLRSGLNRTDPRQQPSCEIRLAALR